MYSKLSNLNDFQSAESGYKDDFFDTLLKAERVINWHDLENLLDVQKKTEGTVPIFLRAVVFIEFQALTGSAVTPRQLRDNTDRYRSFLKLGRHDPAPSEAAVHQFILQLSESGKLDTLRSRFRRQISPWLPWLDVTFSGFVNQSINGFVNERGELLSDFLIKELQTSDLQIDSSPGASASLIYFERLIAPLGPFFDKLVGLGFFIAYKVIFRRRKTGLRRLIWRKNLKMKNGQRKARVSFKDWMLPVLDILIGANLRNISRHMSEKFQIDSVSLNSISKLQDLDRISYLLYLRGRLFFASGDYKRAYYFFIAASAWKANTADPSEAGLGSLFFYIGMAAQLSAQFARAEEAYRIGLLYGVQNPYLLRNLGFVLLATEKEDEAYRYLHWSAQLCKGFFMAHQNLAGMYDTAHYIPRAFDRVGYPEILLYDAYYLLGEQFVSVGDGRRGLECYGKALRKQKELAQKVGLSGKIRKILTDNYGIPLHEPIRILPYEWVTLIGHIAMLDSYLKLQKLGMGQAGEVLLLAPHDKVANHTYLNLWRPHVRVIDHPYLIDDLFPYQRCFGDAFNGYLRRDGSAGDWTELGALGQKEWDRSGQGPLIAISPRLKQQGFESLRKMGLSESDWFVALHIRSSGFHYEGKRSIQTHRNAEVEDYIPAIKAITSQGGWVIRMGDATMNPLPFMDRVIDYPHTEFKSEQCDIFLAATARFFLGTTSGLTNAVISLGTPCLLVNCISNYFQLWNNRVLFTLKPLWHRKERRYLNLSEMVSENFRWKIFNINNLADLHLEPHSNTSGEIEEAVREMLKRLERGNILEETEADVRLRELCKRGGNPNYFGNGRLSQTFFKNTKTDLFLM